MTRRPARGARSPSAAAAAALAGVLVLSPALALASAPLDSVGVWLQAQRVLPADASEPSCFGPSHAFEKFGFSIATDGDVIAVGMRGSGNLGECVGARAVYIFERAADGWQQTAKLDGRDDGSDDETRGFGFAAALDGDVLAVGAPFARNGGVTSHGAVFVFERSGGQWFLAARLEDPGDKESYEYFGYAVAVDGGVVAVGAPQDNNEGGHRAGAVFVYQRSGDAWALADRFVGPAQSAAFGVSLAFDGGTLLAGAPNARHVAAYGLVEGAWAVVDELLPADPPNTFGYALGLDGDVAIVGAAYDRRILGQELPCTSLVLVYTCAIGSAYIFERGGAGWALVAELQNPRHAPEEHFGYDVAVGDGVAVVGAHGAHPAPTGPGTGAIYIYERTDLGWVLAASPLGDDTTPGDWFGWAVGVAGRTALASAILDDNRGDGSPPPLDDLGSLPACVPQVPLTCADGRAAGTVYAFEKTPLLGLPDKPVWTG